MQLCAATLDSSFFLSEAGGSASLVVAILDQFIGVALVLHLDISSAELRCVAVVVELTVSSMKHVHLLVFEVWVVVFRSIVVSQMLSYLWTTLLGELAVEYRNLCVDLSEQREEEDLGIGWLKDVDSVADMTSFVLVRIATVD